MGVLRETWERTPRTTKVATLTVLGVLGTVSALRGVDGIGADATPTSSDQPKVALSIGVICAAQGAHVSYTELGKAYTIHCATAAGKHVMVSGLAKLKPGDPSGPNDYSGIVYLPSAVGGGVDFAFKGLDGTATLTPSAGDDGIARNENSTGPKGLKLGN